MDLLEDTHNSYDIIAKYFSVTRVFTWKWTDVFINKLNNNSFILDVGSGNGRNCQYKNHIMVGIDLSIEQLKMNNYSNNDVHGNMISLPFLNNTFDAIICIASFHHLSTIKEREDCLNEMKRILIKNGKILLSVWSINQPAKTKRKFNYYGNNLVNWTTPDKNIIVPRYYYIFEFNEIKNLLCKFFNIEKYYWDSGNEIFELINNK